MKAICTTTINPPTEAIRRFIDIAERNDWRIYIAGDIKTPHDAYYKLESDFDVVRYIAPWGQEDRFPKLSELIKWNCIQRRNFAMLAAYLDGAEVLALIDDDNIPTSAVWGHNLTIGREVDVWVYNTYDSPVFDPISDSRNIWHRGVPIQLLDSLPVMMEVSTEKRTPLVQADLWSGAPDIDAVCRIAGGDHVAWHPRKAPYAGSVAGPFNSQNTFIHRSVMPVYFLFPFMGRADDIFASYITQAVYPKSVVYGNVTVNQDRNPHDLVRDLEDELIVYRHTLELIQWLQHNEPSPNHLPIFFPQRAIDAWSEWCTILK